MSEPAPIVLVVDDEIQIRRFLRTGFELNGFVVHEAGTGAEAVRTATLRPIDLAIVDLGLPDMDGGGKRTARGQACRSSCCQFARPRRKSASARTQRRRLRGQAVRNGGTAARVRVALTRQMRAVSGEPTVKAGPLTIDLAARAVLLNDKRLTLTPKEYRLLQVLAQHAGNVVTHQHLLKEVWGSIHVHDTHYLRIFVRKLRQKIEPHPDTPKILVTELGVGYRLVQSGAEGDAGAWSDNTQAKSET
jgi:two-component system KDP operon response regulator KdpE